MSSEVAMTTGRAPAGIRLSRLRLPGRETDKLLKRAAKGDESCLPEVQALLADGERGTGVAGGCRVPCRVAPPVHRRTRWPGKHVSRERGCKARNSDRVQADLEGPNPTPIERLLAERASLCWFVVNWYEERFVNASDMSITQADYFQRRIHRAHQRFLSAVETLARVRKLAVPSLN